MPVPLIERAMELWRGFLGTLPLLAVALVVLAATWVLASLAGRLVDRLVSRSKVRRSLIELFKNLSAIGVWIIGVLIAMAVVFPEMSATDLVATLGLGSIAVGFAFKDIFENFIAGVIVLSRDPMRIGDFIECSGVKGKVERISIRDTLVRQTDGQLVILPNAILFKNPVEILTDYDERRQTLIVGVAYDEDIDEARGVIEKSIEGLTRLAKDRPVQVFATAFNSSSLDFEVAWWTGSTPLAQRQSRDEVVTAIKSGLDGAGIEIPFPYRTLTFKEPLPLARARAT